MKRNYFHLGLCLLLACLMAGPVYAAPKSKKSPAKTSKTAKKSSSSSSNKWAKNKLDLYQIHNLALWGGVGYSGMVNNHPMNIPSTGLEGTSKFIGGAGGILGIGYEWHYKKFQLLLGPEFRLFSSYDKLTFDKTASIAGTDASSAYVVPGQTKYFDLQKYGQNNVFGQIMLPVMVGGNWEKTEVPMYFLVGAKVGYTLFSNYKQSGNLHTYIHDDMAYDPEWNNIRDLGTNKYVSKGKSSNFGLDVAISAEVGLNLDSYLSEEFQAANEERRYPWHMRVALFMDYGLPIHTIGNSDNNSGMRTVAEDHISTTSHYDTYLASKANSLLVGAKFTALMQLNRPKQPKPKNPYMVVYVVNGRTGKPEAAEVSITPTASARPRTQKKASNAKGVMILRLKPAEYTVSVAKNGFLPTDKQSILLIENQNNDLKQKLDTNNFVIWPIPVFTCTVRDSKTHELIPATIELVENHEDDSKSIATIHQDLVKGSASYKLPLGKDYSALVSASNHQQQIFHVGEQNLDDITMNFELVPEEKKGKTYIIRNLFFASDETKILPQSEPALQELYEYLSENPDVRIRITGHTDWVGTDKDNQILSEGRSASVKQSMVDRGIDPNRMETEGKGESQPIDTNETEEGRQNNRRVEFTIL